MWALKDSSSAVQFTGYLGMCQCMEPDFTGRYFDIIRDNSQTRPSRCLLSAITRSVAGSPDPLDSTQKCAQEARRLPDVDRCRNLERSCTKMFRYSRTRCTASVSGWRMRPQDRTRL